MSAETPSTCQTTVLWTVKQAAAYWQVSERTIRAWIDKGALQAVRRGGVVRIVPGRPSQA
jgi:excisionase family DNA binding protein